MPNLAMDVSKDEIVFYHDTTKTHHNIPNSFKAIQKFLRRQGFDPTDTMVGCESTGDYHNEPCMAALRLGYTVKIINPILTKQVIKTTIRNKKTDYNDAEIIAKLLQEGHGEIVNESHFQDRKKTLLRTQKKLMTCVGSLKMMRASLRRKGQSMDVQDMIASIDRCIDSLKEEADDLTKKAVERKERQEELIESIPGFGEKLAAIVSVEAGDIKRFPSASQFKAYAGIDPKITQSGTMLHTGHMTKRGNGNLRWALFLAANVNRIHDPELKEFYEKKRSEGKSYRHATNAVARKLCERIYAIVLKNREYEVRKTKTTIDQHS